MIDAAIPIFLLAVLLDRFLGDPPNRFHPVVLMGSWIRTLASRAPAAGARAQFFYGMGIILAGALVFGLPVVAFLWLLGMYPLIGVVVSALLLKLVFALRRLLEAGREVQAALACSDLPEARRLLAWHLVSRDTSRLDQGLAASAVVESLAENLTDSFVAPLFYFMLGCWLGHPALGVAAAWIYRLSNTADAMIGYHSERYEYLGKFAARLDDVLNWLPARISALLLVLAAPLAAAQAGGAMRRAWQTMVGQHARTASPNAGWTMSAAAGALGVILEKEGHYRLEGGARFPSAPDIRRCERLVLTAAMIWVLLQTALLWGFRYVF